jgi:hypothetical protein
MEMGKQTKYPPVDRGKSKQVLLFGKLNPGRLNL